MIRRIVMAPFSNSRMRDWPYFRSLAVLCVDELDAVVEFVGANVQRQAVNAMVRALPADRYINHCGRLSWAQTGAIIRAAACVVANNSGIGHFAAELGAPVVSIFAATHSPFEWMPRGPNVAVIVRHTACTLCGLDGGLLSDCPYERRCLTDIAPADVLTEIRRMTAGPHRAAPVSASGEPGAAVIRGVP